MNKLKGVFKPLQCYFRCGLSWYPVLWCSKPTPIKIHIDDLIWKDKWDTPRYEACPHIWIHLFGFNIIWYWDLPESLLVAGYNIDEYWEQALWYLYYHNTYSQGLLPEPDINAARTSWPWSDFKTKKSTWKNIFLIK